MPKKSSVIKTAWVHPDGVPELTEAIFARGTFVRDGVAVKRGRPPLKRPKRMLSLRVGQDVLDGLRGLGRGWHRTANEALRMVVLDANLKHALWSWKWLVHPLSPPMKW